MEELEDSGFILRGDYDFILVKGTHKKRAHGKLKVSDKAKDCLLYTSPSPRDATLSRMPSSA